MRNTIEKQIEELGIKVNGTAPEGSNITEKLTSFVDEYQGGQELPETLGTAGQVLTVNQAGTGVEWADAAGGGSDLPIVKITAQMTVADFLSAAGYDGSATIMGIALYNGDIINFSIKNYGGAYLIYEYALKMEIYNNMMFNTSELMTNILSNGTLQVKLPQCTEGEGTWVFKYIAGTGYTWVEETV